MYYNIHCKKIVSCRGLSLRSYFSFIKFFLFLDAFFSKWNLNTRNIYIEGEEGWVVDTTKTSCFTLTLDFTDTKNLQSLRKKLFFDLRVPSNYWSQLPILLYCSAKKTPLYLEFKLIWIKGNIWKCIHSKILINRVLLLYWLCKINI